MAPELLFSTESGMKDQLYSPVYICQLYLQDFCKLFLEWSTLNFQIINAVNVYNGPHFREN